ncbi:SgcJ/EcaC family oxidoreductase [Neobacillus pocheonensis]|uniref:SgcJ/EcaC family oxidoreductase n=1 Tax=Neobacillus pocheonensis TaxID=363869 RepID=UPI003D28E931
MNNEIALIKELYTQFLDGWNNQNAVEMMNPFAVKSELIGYDGSQYSSREEAVSNLKQIFAHHQTASFVAKVREVRFFGSEVAILRAIAGMVPPGGTEINSNVNTHHTLVAHKNDGKWQIVLLQNTPAQFHGRPELVQQMTEELQELI